MQFKSHLWSATTTPFRGGGLYFGLTPLAEQASFVAAHTAKQIRGMTGGSVLVRPDSKPLPILFLNVRDPSAVSVRPRDTTHAESDFRHVDLVFQIRDGEPIANELLPLYRQLLDTATLDASAPTANGAFVMAIGLPATREDRFVRDACLHHTGQSWGDLCTRLKDLGNQPPPNA